MRAGIAGAGLLGRLLALQLLERGWETSLFDRDTMLGVASCGFVAAGMLSPVGEVRAGEEILFELGLESLNYWPKILASLPEAICFQQTGSLLTAHPNDYPDLAHYVARLQTKLKRSDVVQRLSKDRAAQLEPALKFNEQVFYLPQEGHIDNVKLFSVLSQALLSRGVNWYEQTTVETVQAGKIVTSAGSYDFDQVFDCRGLGAQKDYPELRGVRGELIWLQTAEVKLSRPIRLLHPRYGIYIVPRPNNIYVVGASEIESEDFSAISVRSLLELLTAAYTLHSGFAEARVVKTLVNCRPAFPDHLPRIYTTEGLIAINGLYRHGYLLAPVLLREVSCFLDQGFSGVRYPQLFKRL